MSQEICLKVAESLSYEGHDGKEMLNLPLRDKSGGRKGGSRGDRGLELEDPEPAGQKPRGPEWENTGKMANDTEAVSLEATSELAESSLCSSGDDGEKSPFIERNIENPNRKLKRKSLSQEAKTFFSQRKASFLSERQNAQVDL